MTNIKKHYLYIIVSLLIMIPFILLFMNYDGKKFSVVMIYLFSFTCFSFVFVYYLIDLLVLKHYKKLDNGTEVNLKFSVDLATSCLGIIYIIIFLVWGHKLRFKANIIFNSLDMFLVFMFLVFSSFVSYFKTYYLIVGDNYLIYKDKKIKLNNIAKYKCKSNNLITLLFKNRKDKFVIPDYNDTLARILEKKL